MPVWSPRGLRDELRRAAGDSVARRPDPLQFETALPSELALRRQGVKTETSSLSVHKAGDIFATAQREAILLQVEQVNPSVGVTYVEVEAIDLAPGGAQEIVIVLESLPPPDDGPVIVEEAPASETASAADLTDEGQAAEDIEVSAELEEGQQSPEGGEVTNEDGRTTVGVGDGDVAVAGGEVGESGSDDAQAYDDWLSEGELASMGGGG